MMLDHDAHRVLALLPAIEPETQAQIDRRDDTAAQIERAGHFLRRQRNARDALWPQYVLDLQHRNAEQLTGNRERNEVMLPFAGVAAGGFRGGGIGGDGHAAPLSSEKASDRVCSSASRSN